MSSQPGRGQSHGRGGRGSGRGGGRGSGRGKSQQMHKATAPASKVLHKAPGKPQEVLSQAATDTTSSVLSIPQAPTGQDLHIVSAPYPYLLEWFSGGQPETKEIAAELDLMAHGEDFKRLLTALRLHGEIDNFISALKMAFEDLDLADPRFQQSDFTLDVLTSEDLKTVGVACLTAIALGQSEEDFATELFTWNTEGLSYKEVAVFATVAGTDGKNLRERVFVSSERMLYITSKEHSLKGWLRRGDHDVEVKQIHGVAPDEKESGYNALEAAENVVWECSHGDLKTGVGVIQAIAKSEAFAQIAWYDSSYCTAGWVASLTPTLTTRGLFKIPGKEVEIAQNVHSTAAMGSAWVNDMQGSCNPKNFPPKWAVHVGPVLFLRAKGHHDFRNITTFCALLKQGGFKKLVPENPVGDPRLKQRIDYLIGKSSGNKEILHKLPKIAEYYPDVFNT